MDLYEYIKARIKDDFDVEDVNEAALRFVEQLRKRKDIGKYNPKIWGDYPKLLKEYIKRRFGIIL